MRVTSLTRTIAVTTFLVMAAVSASFAIAQDASLASDGAQLNSQQHLPPLSRSGGPYADWLAGPDGPIVPPQTFQLRSIGPSSVAPFGRAGGPCAAPATPNCARDPDTYRDETSRHACEAQVVKHVREVFDYRGCLDAEASRAMRSANEAIRRLKCRKPTLKDCD